MDDINKVYKKGSILLIAVLGVICLTVSAHALYVDEKTHPAYLEKPLPENYEGLLKETSFCLPEGVLIDSSWVLTTRNDIWEVTMPNLNTLGQITSTSKIQVDVQVRPRKITGKELASHLILLHLEKPIIQVAPVKRERYLKGKGIPFYLISYDNINNALTRVVGTNESTVLPKTKNIDLHFLNESTLWEAVMSPSNPYDLGAGVFTKTDDTLRLVGILFEGSDSGDRTCKFEQVQGEPNTFIDNVIIAHALGAKEGIETAIGKNYTFEEAPISVISSESK